ncbi:HTH-type transcriptional activator Btr [BD1-7 clade bacterium]|uniref:HTH-type transcriptional activator Btr n=1 Tax=BD1-7 clade bacterium TaxID=2029982 RepID=A0A5S9QYI8_9GAMM|nr:HTH-type transcriptional activator Btr [BD1-7 clade bacterium]
MIDTENYMREHFGDCQSEKALAVLRFTTVAPAPALQGVVKHYWFASMNVDALPYMSRQYPDASMGMVFDLLAPQKSVFEAHNTEVRLCDFSAQTALLGVRFAVGGAQRLLGGLAVNEHGTIPLDMFGHDALIRLCDELLAADSDWRRVEILNGSLLALLCDQSSNNRSNNHQWIQAVLPTSAGVRVNEVASALGYTHRQFDRQFYRLCGYTPKKAASMIRVDAARRLLSARHDLAMQDIVHGLGYFDQAHFIRDFKRYSDSTPSAYRQRKYLQLWSSKNRGDN